MEFRDLMNRHDGAVGYIVGPGPSLDHLNLKSLGDAPRICLRNSIRVVPQYAGSTYWLYLDAVPEIHRDLWVESVSEDVVELVPDNMIEPNGFKAHKPLTRSSVTFTLQRDPCVLKLSRKSVSESRFVWAGMAMQGSVIAAAFMAWYMGWSAAHLIGIDGGTGLAESMKKFYDRFEECSNRECKIGDSYNQLKDACIRVLLEKGVQVCDFSRPDREKKT